MGIAYHFSRSGARGELLKRRKFSAALPGPGEIRAVFRLWELFQKITLVFLPATCYNFFGIIRVSFHTKIKMEERT
jgi:hypothetical protein